jgi:hypothetical protein
VFGSLEIIFVVSAVDPSHTVTPAIGWAVERHKSKHRTSGKNFLLTQINAISRDPSLYVNIKISETARNNVLDVIQYPDMQAQNRCYVLLFRTKNGTPAVYDKPPIVIR